MYVYMYLLIYRWLDLWRIAIALEKSMRKEASDLIGDNLKSKMASFSFKYKDGGEVIKEAVEGVDDVGLYMDIILID